MMMIHSAVAVRSEAAAARLFEDIFGFRRLYQFQIPPKAFQTLFDLTTDSVTALVYDAGNAQIEVFILGKCHVSPKEIHHICLGFADREEIIEKARAAGLEIRIFEREDSSVVFIVDQDGNLYELKNNT
jgi:catechol 2,3-dioxygenase-like lactoylglutathione lyase family enzyme